MWRAGAVGDGDAHSSIGQMTKHTDTMNHAVS
jgi:hypothetical protein